jgi:hypothetical protein
MKQEKLETVLMWIMIFFINFYIYNMFYYFTFWIHEYGHVLFGFIGNIIFLDSSEIPKITGWGDYTFFNISNIIITLPMPNQVTSSKNMLLPFGGSIFIFLISVCISYLIFRKTKDKKSFLLILIFLFHEFFGNFLCGSDNTLGYESNICSTNILIHNWNYFFILFGVLYTTFLDYDFLKKILDKYFNKTIKLIKN